MIQKVVILLLVLCLVGLIGYILTDKLLLADSSDKADKEMEDELYKGFNEYCQHGKFNDSFQKKLNGLNIDVKQIYSDNPPQNLRQELVCTTCVQVVDVFYQNARNGTDREILKNYANILCKQFHIEADHICDGIVDLSIDTFLYMPKNNPKIDGKLACSIVFQKMGCHSSDSNRLPWEIQIHEGGQNIKPNASNIPLKVLQLTDIHYDPVYQEGSNAKCDLPMCCNYDSGNVTSPEDAAGYWTDYNCDIPLHTIDATLDHISTEHKDLDYVYFTGDIISHRYWNKDNQNISNDIITVLNRFAETFGNVSVYPIAGNHDTNFCNSFAPLDVTEPELSTQWLFNLFADQWSRWLPADTKETILRGGFYTVLVRPGFRIIALNNNVADVENWWLIFDQVDPYGQLQWMENVLYAAERDGESVHILSHIPSGDRACYIPWGEQFTRIIERYSNTISGIFNGHTHFDELIIYYKSNNAVSVGWNGGSLTPFNDKNPNYRIYSVDSASFDVIDFDQYTFNLTKANLDPNTPLAWFHLYSFKEEYGMDDLSPASVSNLTTRMAKDHTLQKKYFRNKVRDSDPLMKVGCDDECSKENLCKMVTSTFKDSSKCVELMKQWNSAVTEI